MGPVVIHGALLGKQFGARVLVGDSITCKKHLDYVFELLRFSFDGICDELFQVLDSLVGDETFQVPDDPLVKQNQFCFEGYIQQA